MDIGERLRQLRQAKGLSQIDIADSSGLERPHVSRVECGHTTPTLETLERWSEALDVPMYRLFVQDAVTSAACEDRTAVRITYQEKRFLALLKRMNEADRRLWFSLGVKMVRRGGGRG